MVANVMKVLCSEPYLSYQEYTCAVLATSVQLWPIQVEELATKHLLESNCPAQNTAIKALLSSTYHLGASLALLTIHMHHFERPAISRT